MNHTPQNRFFKGTLVSALCVPAASADRESKTEDALQTKPPLHWPFLLSKMKKNSLTI